MNEEALQQALADTQNLGEMPDADAVGTVGSPDCGDMVRMWIKYRDKDGRKVIDKASFQSFGCQTAIAVASIATELIRGKTKEEALAMQADDLSRPLGALPPMKEPRAWRLRARREPSLMPSVPPARQRAR